MVQALAYVFDLRPYVFDLRPYLFEVRPETTSMSFGSHQQLVAESGGDRSDDDQRELAWRAIMLAVCSDSGRTGSGDRRPP
jgi:hypothetical protein